MSLFETNLFSSWTFHGLSFFLCFLFNFFAYTFFDFFAVIRTFFSRCKTDVITSRSSVSSDSNGVRHADALEFPEDKFRFLKCHSSEMFICAWNRFEDLMASG